MKARTKNLHQYIYQQRSGLLILIRGYSIYLGNTEYGKDIMKAALDAREMMLEEMGLEAVK